MKLPWNELAFESPYLAVVTAKKLLQEGQMTVVDNILESVVESMKQSEKKVVKIQLTLLMLHIIQWKCQPEKRGTNLVISIRSTRRKIYRSQEEMPSLNRDFLESIWHECFDSAQQDARDEMGKNPEIVALNWDDVFGQIYEIWDN